jgi:hypothetical protein
MKLSRKSPAAEIAGDLAVKNRTHRTFLCVRLLRRRSLFTILHGTALPVTDRIHFADNAKG